MEFTRNPQEGPLTYEHFYEDVSFFPARSESIAEMSCQTHGLIASAIFPGEWSLCGFRVSVWLERLREDHLRQHHENLGPQDVCVTSRIL